MNILKKSILMAALLILVQVKAFSADGRNAAILYPKNNSVVGKKVNIVLDPTDVPFFQVVVNKKEYPVVDTSSGAHAYQGVELEQGRNTVTVNVLNVEGEKENKKTVVLASRSIEVFNREGSFSPVPAGFDVDSFHTREREASCATCHRMEVTKQDVNHGKPEDVLCFACHREIPKGAQIHGPAAQWNCLACHNPDLYPAKYAFSSVDPWKVAKSTKTVEPSVFTVPTLELFSPLSAVIASKDTVRRALEPMLNFAKENPSYKIRLEVHHDPVPQKPKKGKAKGFKNSMALTSARAKTLAAFLKNAGIPAKRIIAVGMGEKMPKAPNDTQAGRHLNNRAEIVVYPPEVKVLNSANLPVLKDRERVTVTILYNRGPQINKFRISEQLPKNASYVKGTGSIRGRFVEPKQNGKELSWEITPVDRDFNESVTYIVKKTAEAEAIPPTTKVTFLSGQQELSRILDPAAPATEALTVKQTCLKCHSPILEKPFKHGPVDAGYCNLCHDPHASPNLAWIRKASWELCTTCHAGHGSGVHVVAGFVKSPSHPTRGPKDPARPGKRLSCASCHEPHSSSGQALFAYNIKSRPDLCAVCHRKK